MRIANVMLFSCQDLSWLFSAKDYWYATVSALIGSLIGIWWAKRQFRAQIRDADEKVRLSIVASLRFNKARAVQAIGQLENQGMPNYPLDGARLSSLIIQARGFLHDDLLEKLDWHRFQLDHITAKLAVLNDYYLVGTTILLQAQAAHLQHLKALTDSLIEHYRIVVAATDELASAVEKAVTK